MFDASRHITKRVPTLVCFAGNVPTDLCLFRTTAGNYSLSTVGEKISMLWRLVKEGVSDTPKALLVALVLGAMSHACVGMQNRRASIPSLFVAHGTKLHPSPATGLTFNRRR
jgi:hypothetical protein